MIGIGLFVCLFVCLFVYNVFNNRRTLLSLISIYYNKEVIEDPSYKYSPSGTYHPPPKSNYEDYIEYIKEFPLVQHPEIFGMHENVDISKDLLKTKTVSFILIYCLFVYLFIRLFVCLAV